MALSSTTSGVNGAKLLCIDSDDTVVDSEEDGTRMFAFRPKPTKEGVARYLLNLDAVCDRLAGNIDKGTLVPTTTVMAI